MDKLVPLFLLIVGYFLGVWSSRLMYGYAFKRYTEEVYNQYKKLLDKESISGS